MESEFRQTLARRLAAAREQRKLNQVEVAAKMGFKDRQILSNIELGKREVSAEDLTRFCDLFDISWEALLDPFRLEAGECAFSWRASRGGQARDDFGQRVATLIATYRRLGHQLGEAESPLQQSINLTKRSHYEDADLAGERLAQEWNLGEVPARRLQIEIEARLNVLLLRLDAPEGVSGAACRIPEFRVAVVNRREPVGRQNYDLAHELFHLLTWDVMPPDEEDLDPSLLPPARRKVETLANRFASALLMPGSSVSKLWADRGDQELNVWLCTAADYLEVTAKALYWRLRTLGLVGEASQLQLRDDALAWNGQPPTERQRLPLYSQRFVARLHAGFERGRLSVRKAAKLLDCTIEDIEGLFRAYGMTVPFDL